MPQFQELIANRDGVIRREKLIGKDYIVAPMVMLTEGVHQGSNGPLYYPAEELAKLPAVWNHKPAVIYHPKEKGVPVSACIPTMLEKHAVGIVLNTEWDAEKSKLRAEAWIDEARIKQVDMRVYKALMNNEIMEVSTGLFTENTAVDGEWNGEKYVAIARNYRPDHLAILPDQTGACSVADGAGLMQVNSQETWNKFSSVIGELVVNEQSHEQLRGQLCRVIEDDFGYAAYVEEVYDDYLVYVIGGKYYRVNYSMDGETAKLSGQPTKVERVVDYQPAANAETPPAEQDSDTMTKKSIIDGLISNKKTTWEEKDRKTLDAMPEETLKKIVENTTADPPADPPKPDDKKGDGTPPPNPTPQTGTPPADPPANNKEETVTITKSQWSQLQGLLDNAQKVTDAEKQRYIGIISANEGNQLTEDQLKGLTTDVLRGMAALARGASGNPSAIDDPLGLNRYDFSGAGFPGDPSLIGNDDDDEESQPLVPPTFNTWQEQQAKKAK